jgi:hypothetical protein
MELAEEDYAMPLRDHSLAATWKRTSWEGFHGAWPAMIVQRLVRHLPAEYAAEPRVELGTYPDVPPSAGVALTKQYEYEVRVFDQRRARRLVAAVEIVSPANKDRAENRRAFVAKWAALLQHGVCVSVVDVITAHKFNLYTELLAMLDRSDPAFTEC